MSMHHPESFTIDLRWGGRSSARIPIAHAARPASCARRTARTTLPHEHSFPIHKRPRRPTWIPFVSPSVFIGVHPWLFSYLKPCHKQPTRHDPLPPYRSHRLHPRHLVYGPL